MHATGRLLEVKWAVLTDCTLHPKGYFSRKPTPTVLKTKLLFLQELIFTTSVERIEVRKCLLSFDAESFVFQIAIQKFKD